MIIDVRLFDICFCCFRGEEKNCIQKLNVFQGNLSSYRTHIIVNGCYRNTRKLVFTVTRTRVIVNPVLLQLYLFLGLL